MITDSFESSELIHREKSAFGPRLLAGLLALLITGALFAGYLYFRKRNVQQNAKSTIPTGEQVTVQKGPPKAHILVDDAMLRGGQTIIGGTVRNISQESLSGLTVELELKRRNSPATERMQVAINPVQLAPNEEGRYALKLPTQHFSSVRLVGLNAGGGSDTLAFTTAPGQKRLPERLEPKVVIVPRPSSGRDEFLNTPDKPARVP